MARHADEGDEVYVLNVCDRSERHRFDADMVASLRTQARKMCEIVGVKELFHGKLADEYLDISLADVIRPIEEVVEKIQPEVVYTHHKGDVNQDHRAVFMASLVATRPFTYAFIKEVYSFEVLSTTEQAPGQFPGWQFSPSYFVDIEEQVNRKIKGMKCYKSEINGFPFPRSVRGIETLARYRGMQMNSQFAEAFEIIRARR